MRYYLLMAAIMVVGLAAPTSAQADGSIGVWRWLGLGWGPGYHAGPPAPYSWHTDSAHHGAQGQPQFNQQPWNQPQFHQPWQAPQETGPALQPIPEKSANLGKNLAPPFNPAASGPAFPQNLESARRNAPLR